VGVAALGEVGVRLLDLRSSVSAPSEAIPALVRELSSGDLAAELGVTLQSYAEGLALATVAGVVLGVLLGSSRTVLDGSSVLLEFLRPIPAIALIPLAIMVFGLGVPMIRFVVAYAALWPILINTLYGVRGGDRLLDDVARTSGASTLGVLLRVRLPAALPSVAAGVRVSAAAALHAGITAEFVTGTDGVGSYMQRQQLAFQLPELYAAIVLVGLLGYAINLVLRAGERRAVFWVGEQRLEAR
jgi:NitT/TauT family transport system permease protein